MSNKKPLQKRRGFLKNIQITSPGHYLLSQGANPLLPSAQSGLTAGFGMGPGGSRSGIGTRDNWCHSKMHRVSR